MPDQSSAATEHALLQEITAPLQRLPDDPLALVEAEFPTAMRGYDRHAVDDYVAQMTDLVGELHATRSPEAAVRRALERVGDQISGILQRAHETSEQITAQSRVEAEDRLQDARREAATIIDAATERVRELDADADRIWSERQRIIADADDLSAQLTVVVREAIDRFPAEDPRSSVPDTEPPTGIETDDGPGTGIETDDGPATGVGTESEPGTGIDADVELSPDDDDVMEVGELAGDADPEGPDEIEATRPFSPPPPAPRRLTDEDSTQIIPPSSDAAQHRRDG